MLNTLLLTQTLPDLQHVKTGLFLSHLSSKNAHSLFTTSFRLRVTKQLVGESASVSVYLGQNVKKECPAFGAQPDVMQSCFDDCADKSEFQKLQVHHSEYQCSLNSRVDAKGKGDLAESRVAHDIP